MTGALLAACAGMGVLLLLQGARPPAGAGGGQGPGARTRRCRNAMSALELRARQALERAGMEAVSPARLAAAAAATGGLGAMAALILFGPGPAVALLGAAGASVPLASFRRRRTATRRATRDAWPRLIEELRVLTGSAGRPIPQALLEVGLRGPDELRPAFRAAQREWSLTTDFARTVAVLKARLADPTADVVCETLLVAQEVGGDVDDHLRRLADDRRRDLRDRKEAEAKQAGARLARAFVVLVPAGMAVAGLNVGDGRAAYHTAWGQALVAAGIAMVAACWLWAASILRLPEPERVFDR